MRSHTPRQNLRARGAPTAVRVKPISAKVEEIRRTDLWKAEEVTLTFEREEPTVLYVIKPIKHRGKLQPIIYSPGSDCCFAKRPNREALEHLRVAEFVATSGRMLVIPIWLHCCPE